MINVFFGHACNFSCGYCLQKNESGAVNGLRPTPEFAARLARHMRESGDGAISYWGGEPLLYFDEIARLHEWLLAEGVRPTFVKVVSNGSLLTPERVDFLNRHGVYFVLSDHDRFDAVDMALVSQLRKLSLSFLFTRLQPTAEEFFTRVRGFEAEFRRPYYTYLHWVRATDGCPPDFYFDESSLAAHMAYLEELAARAERGDRHAVNFFKTHMAEWERGLSRERGSAQPLCFAPDAVAIDLNGDRYTCHHTTKNDFRVGNLFSRLPPVLTEQQLASKRRAEGKLESGGCASCHIRSWCRAGCTLSNTPAIDCSLHKQLHRLFSKISRETDGKTDINSIEA